MGWGGVGACVCVQPSNGNLVLPYSGAKAVWGSQTTGHPGAHLDFQRVDGDLVLRARGGDVLWASGAKMGAAKVVCCRMTVTLTLTLILTPNSHPNADPNPNP